MRIRWKWVTLAASAAAAVALVALALTVGPWTNPESRTRSDLEAVLDLSTQPPELVTTYRYVEEHRSMFERIPCYCGCGKALAHQDLFDCFVIGPGVYSDHASGCMVCGDETNDVQRLAGEGQSARDIRTWIDGEYSRYGAPTDTP